MRTVQAYRFALDLTPGQERAVLGHAGAARVAYNWALARVKAVMDQRAAERSYGVADDRLTPAVSWSFPALRRAWNAAKRDVAPWWRECSKEAFNTGLDALARGLKNWADSRSGKRAGRRVGFPRFTSRRRTTPCVRFTTGAIRVAPDRRHVVLPRLGRLKVHESTRKLARRVEAGTARIMSATVRRDGGRWHVAFTVEVERAERSPARPGSVVGVDVGITYLAVLSTGELVPNPRHLVGARSRLRALGRILSRKVGPDRRTGRRPSHRWQRASARLGRAHARVGCLRRDGLHKLTTRLTREHGTVVAEDLHVAGMLANRGLARHITDAGFAELRRQLAYKTGWNGGRLLVADRWYPSCPSVSTTAGRVAWSWTATTTPRVTWPPWPLHTTPPGVARWQHVEPTRRPAYAGRWLRSVNPAPQPWVRPGPSHRKAGLPTVCSLEHTERGNGNVDPLPAADHRMPGHTGELIGVGHPYRRVCGRKSW